MSKQKHKIPTSVQFKGFASPSKFNTDSTLYNTSVSSNSHSVQNNVFSSLSKFQELPDPQSVSFLHPHLYALATCRSSHTKTANLTSVLSFFPRKPKTPIDQSSENTFDLSNGAGIEMETDSDISDITYFSISSSTTSPKTKKRFIKLFLSIFSHIYSRLAFDSDSNVQYLLQCILLNLSLIPDIQKMFPTSLLPTWISIAHDPLYESRKSDADLTPQGLAKIAWKTVFPDSDKEAASLIVAIFSKSHIKTSNFDFVIDQYSSFTNFTISNPLSMFPPEDISSMLLLNLLNTLQTSDLTSISLSESFEPPATSSSSGSGSKSRESNSTTTQNTHPNSTTNESHNPQAKQHANEIEKLLARKKVISKEMNQTQTNKATEKHRGRLRSKLAVIDKRIAVLSGNTSSHSSQNSNGSSSSSNSGSSSKSHVSIVSPKHKLTRIQSSTISAFSYIYSFFARYTPSDTSPIVTSSTLKRVYKLLSDFLRHLVRSSFFYLIQNSLTLVNCAYFDLLSTCLSFGQKVDQLFIEPSTLFMLSPLILESWSATSFFIISLSKFSNFSHSSLDSMSSTTSNSSQPLFARICSSASDVKLQEIVKMSLIDLIWHSLLSRNDNHEKTLIKYRKLLVSTISNQNYTSLFPPSLRPSKRVSFSFTNHKIDTKTLPNSVYSEKAQISLLKLWFNLLTTLHNPIESSVENLSEDPAELPETDSLSHLEKDFLSKLIQSGWFRTLSVDPVKSNVLVAPILDTFIVIDHSSLAILSFLFEKAMKSKSQAIHTFLWSFLKLSNSLNSIVPSSKANSSTSVSTASSNFSKSSNRVITTPKTKHLSYHESIFNQVESSLATFSTIASSLLTQHPVLVSSIISNHVTTDMGSTVIKFFFDQTDSFDLTSILTNIQIPHDSITVASNYIHSLSTLVSLFINTLDASPSDSHPHDNNADTVHIRVKGKLSLLTEYWLSQFSLFCSKITDLQLSEQFRHPSSSNDGNYNTNDDDGDFDKLNGSILQIVSGLALYSPSSSSLLWGQFSDYCVNSNNFKLFLHSTNSNLRSQNFVWKSAFMVPLLTLDAETLQIWQWTSFPVSTLFNILSSISLLSNSLSLSVLPVTLNLISAIRSLIRTSDTLENSKSNSASMTLSHPETTDTAFLSNEKLIETLKSHFPQSWWIKQSRSYHSLQPELIDVLDYISILTPFAIEYFDIPLIISTPSLVHWYGGLSDTISNQLIDHFNSTQSFWKLFIFLSIRNIRYTERNIGNDHSPNLPSKNYPLNTQFSKFLFFPWAFLSLAPQSFSSLLEYDFSMKPQHPDSQYDQALEFYIQLLPDEFSFFLTHASHAIGTTDDTHTKSSTGTHSDRLFFDAAKLWEWGNITSSFWTNTLSWNYFSTFPGLFDELSLNTPITNLMQTLSLQNPQNPLETQNPPLDDQLDEIDNSRIYSIYVLFNMILRFLQTDKNQYFLQIPVITSWENYLGLMHPAASTFHADPLSPFIDFASIQQLTVPETSSSDGIYTTHSFQLSRFQALLMIIKIRPILESRLKIVIPLAVEAAQSIFKKAESDARKIFSNMILSQDVDDEEPTSSQEIVTTQSQPVPVSGSDSALVSSFLEQISSSIFGSDPSTTNSNSSSSTLSLQSLTSALSFMSTPSTGTNVSTTASVSEASLQLPNISKISFYPLNLPNPFESPLLSDWITSLPSLTHSLLPMMEYLLSNAEILCGSTSLFTKLFHYALSDALITLPTPTLLPNSMTTSPSVLSRFDKHSFETEIRWISVAEPEKSVLIPFCDILSSMGIPNLETLENHGDTDDKDATELNLFNFSKKLYSSHYLASSGYVASTTRLIFSTILKGLKWWDTPIAHIPINHLDKLHYRDIISIRPRLKLLSRSKSNHIQSQLSTSFMSSFMSILFMPVSVKRNISSPSLPSEPLSSTISQFVPVTPDFLSFKGHPSILWLFNDSQRFESDSESEPGSSLSWKQFLPPTIDYVNSSGKSPTITKDVILESIPFLHFSWWTFNNSKKRKNIQTQEYIRADISSSIPFFLSVFTILPVKVREWFSRLNTGTSRSLDRVPFISTALITSPTLKQSSIIPLTTPHFFFFNYTSDTGEIHRPSTNTGTVSAQMKNFEKYHTFGLPRFDAVDHSTLDIPTPRIFSGRFAEFVHSHISKPLWKQRVDTVKYHMNNRRISSTIIHEAQNSITISLKLNLASQIGIDDTTVKFNITFIAPGASGSGYVSKKPIHPEAAWPFRSFTFKVASRQKTPTGIDAGFWNSLSRQMYRLLRTQGMSESLADAEEEPNDTTDGINSNSVSTTTSSSSNGRSTSGSASSSDNSPKTDTSSYLLSFDPPSSIFSAMYVWEMFLKSFLTQKATECPICFSMFDSAQNVCTLKCKTCIYKYHKSCLFKWFKISNNDMCPSCRNPFFG